MIASDSSHFYRALIDVVAMPRARNMITWSHIVGAARSRRTDDKGMGQLMGLYFFTSSTAREIAAHAEMPASFTMTLLGFIRRLEPPPSRNAFGVRLLRLFLFKT